MSSPRESNEPALYPIGTVSDLTGVNAVTLRAWERRYALVEPARKRSGHRLYTQQQIDLINRVVGLLDRGMRIGQVKDHLASEREAGRGRANALWNRYLERMITGVVQFDETALEATYGEALAIYPVKTVTEQLLTPLLKELGRRWQDGEGSIAEEHFFGCYLRSKLGARFHHRVRDRHGPKLLLACLPDERHETGLLLFALAAEDAGYRAVVLGGDVPLAELPDAARKTACAAVVLSGFLTPNSTTLAKLLPAVVRDCAAPIFVGGRASIEAYNAIKRAGAEPLGNVVETGLARMHEQLDARS